MASTQLKSQASVKAFLKTAMVSPYKARPVANLIRGKSVEEAYRRLTLEHKKGAHLMTKLLKSALANAEQKGNINIDRLYVSDLRIDEGPRIKRWMPRAQGRMDIRITRTSHISLGLDEKAAPQKKAAKKSTETKKKTTKKKTTKKKAGK